MEKKTAYLTHEELAELLDVPNEMKFAVDDDALTYDVRDEMWRLRVTVGTEEEIAAQYAE